ncbi:MAG: hypothetical protein PHV68_04470 [Candidatus Gastranaerophilales bacterium]|nr:hypothetical protein [Candidatus Gastranaerophilales bacterium]
MYNLINPILILSIITLTNGAGYVGELPKIGQPFQEEIKEKTVEFKPLAPEDIPDEYKRIILRKKKPTLYEQDMTKAVKILENLKQIINENGDVQMFSANLNSLKFLTNNLIYNYKDKKESEYSSYKELITLADELDAVLENWQKYSIEKKYILISNQSVYTNDKDVDLALNNAYIKIEYLLKKLDSL